MVGVEQGYVPITRGEGAQRETGGVKGDMPQALDDEGLNQWAHTGAIDAPSCSSRAGYTLQGRGVFVGVSLTYSPPSFISLAGSPVVVMENSNANTIGGVLLTAPSALCGSLVATQGRSG
jgi:hypothetical protein